VIDEVFASVRARLMPRAPATEVAATILCLRCTVRGRKLRTRNTFQHCTPLHKDSHGKLEP
jgi:hypothetical protein